MGCWASGQVSVPDEKKNRATADEELSPITTQSLVLRALPSAPLACYTTQGKRGSIHFLFFFVFFLKDPISLFWACCAPASYIPAPTPWHWNAQVYGAFLVGLSRDWNDTPERSKSGPKEKLLDAFPLFDSMYNV